MNESKRMALLKQVGKIEGLNYEGMVIGKIKYQSVHSTSPAQDECTFKKRSPKITVVTCCHTIQQVTHRLTIQLIMPTKPTSNQGVLHKNIIEVSSVLSGEPWTQFSKEEIRWFSHETGDTNSIHLGEQPVVQGLLILKKLQEVFHEKLEVMALNTCIEIKFIQPIYGEEPVYLVHKGNHFQGWSQGMLCFEGKIEDQTNQANQANQKEDVENE